MSGQGRPPLGQQKRQAKRLDKSEDWQNYRMTYCEPHRQTESAEQFEVPWTAISPRVQRLIWAINAIRRPANMIAAGVFCGNTFIFNAGGGGYD